MLILWLVGTRICKKFRDSSKPLAVFFRKSYDSDRFNIVAKFMKKDSTLRKNENTGTGRKTSTSFVVRKNSGKMPTNKQTLGADGRDSSDKKIFAHGVCFRKMFFIFLIGSVIGSIYEEILYMIQSVMATGHLDFALRQGVIYGPFNVVYGFGAVVLCLVLVTKQRPAWKTFLIAALLGGIIEYVISFGQELITHTVSWDYSDRFLNINGRTTIPFMLFWGLLGLVFVDCVYPFCSKMIEKIPIKPGEIIFRVALVLMVIDITISWTAVIRQTLRHNDVPPFTPVGEFYDSYYTDEFLLHYYPNMRHYDLEKE